MAGGLFGMIGNAVRARRGERQEANAGLLRAQKNETEANAGLAKARAFDPHMDALTEGAGFARRPRPAPAPQPAPPALELEVGEPYDLEYIHPGPPGSPFDLVVGEAQIEPRTPPNARGRRR